MKTGQIRHFQLSDGKSEKFWEIKVSESGFEVRFGKIGTAGQTQMKEFPDEATIIKKVEHLIAEKLGKGYVEISQISDLDTEAGNVSGSISDSVNFKATKVSSSSINMQELSNSEILELASNPSQSRQVEGLVAARRSDILTTNST